ncbi:MAG: type II toxin-antitoxin system VapC family toxin [Candidatus Entotheonellia bacterium]
MILLDTHIWVWWVDDNQQLVDRPRHLIQDNVRSGLEVSAISCWEVAKLVQYGRLELACPLEEWMEQALAYPGVQLIELTPRIAIESTKLPGSFHRDPADQIIVATARVYDIPLLTVDSRILQYPHVRTL